MILANISASTLITVGPEWPLQHSRSCETAVARANHKNIHFLPGLILKGLGFRVEGLGFKVWVHSRKLIGKEYGKESQLQDNMKGFWELRVL